jgi:hypothetical protein
MLGPLATFSKILQTPALALTGIAIKKLALSQNL